ncbi:MAG: UDP-glucose/GDP-mannose dehydrogenase family protein [Rickettsiales bacterium]|nr:UDP-glucose/GDP-mannose dehydrogenase family protein [Rickettsiales bacterium]
MKIAIIGTGYVGLVSAVCFAKLGHEVVGVDNDTAKISDLQKNIIPIFEPGLKELLIAVKSDNKITFTTDLKTALNGAQAVFIAVGTPQDEDGSADLTFVLAAAREIAQSSNDYKVIVTKSTVPVGTGAILEGVIKKANPQLEFSVASNPEFLREGSAVEDFMIPDRIVIGSKDDRAKKVLSEIYQKFLAEKIVHTDITTAEMIKYASNSFLATKISFINEISDLCEKTGGDIKQLASAIGLDSRIGSKFLNPGPGFGGSCFPKDIMAIINVAKANNVELSLINSVISSNVSRKKKMVQKISDALGKNIAGKKIALLGLAFKANTDDVRYSPAISIARVLLEKSAKIHATDPEAIENSRKELSDISGVEFFVDHYQAIKDADLIVIATEWKIYSELNFDKIKQLTKSRVIVDLRNLLDPTKVAAAGFKYIYIGGKNHD